MSFPLQSVENTPPKKAGRTSGGSSSSSKLSIGTNRNICGGSSKLSIGTKRKSAHRDVGGAAGTAVVITKQKKKKSVLSPSERERQETTTTTRRQSPPDVFYRSTARVTTSSSTVTRTTTTNGVATTTNGVATTTNGVATTTVSAATNGMGTATPEQQPKVGVAAATAGSAKTGGVGNHPTIDPVTKRQRRPFGTVSNMPTSTTTTAAAAAAQLAAADRDYITMEPPTKKPPLLTTIENGNDGTPRPDEYTPTFHVHRKEKESDDDGTPRPDEYTPTFHVHRKEKESDDDGGTDDDGRMDDDGGTGDENNDSGRTKVSNVEAASSIFVVKDIAADGSTKTPIPEFDFDDDCTADVDVDIDADAESDAEEDGELDPADVNALEFDLSDIIMGIGGNRNARSVAKKPMEKATVAVRKHIEDPDGFFSEQLASLPLCVAVSGIYYAVIKKRNGTEERKIGYAMNMTNRKKRTEENENVQEVLLFKRILNVDMLDEPADRGVRAVWSETLDALKTSKEVHPFQRSLFKAIRDEEGDRLGLRKLLSLQIIESQLQIEKGLSSPQEFLAFDEKAYDKAFSLMELYGGQISELLSGISAHGGSSQIYLRALSSWKTGYVNNLSNNIEATKFLVGDGNWKDTLDFPVFPNPKNVEEGFSTDYTDEEKEGGRQVAFNELKGLKRQNHGLLLMDTNNLIFRDDPNSGVKSTEEVLEQFGFKKVRSFLGSEISLFFCGKKHAVLLHKPLCIAGDSRAFISMEKRALRGLSLAILGHATRAICGTKPIAKEDIVANPIHAMFAFSITRRCFHTNLPISAAFWRKYIMPEGPNALVQNNLQKHPSSPDYPIALRLRTAYKMRAAGKEVKGSDRPVELDLTNYARSLISKVGSNSREDIEGLYSSLHQLLAKSKAGDGYPVDMCSRWGVVKRNCIEGTGLHSIICDRPTKNLGNRLGGPSKRVTNAGLHQHNYTLGQLVSECKPSDEEPGRPFWVLKETAKGGRPPLPVPGDESECSYGEFPGDYPVFLDLAFAGIFANIGYKAARKIEKKKLQKKKKTKHSEAVLHPGLSLKRVISPKDNSTGVTAIHRGHTYSLAVFTKYEKGRPRTKGPSRSSV